MSSGAFQLSRYAASYGSGTNIHPIKIQPETLALSLTIATVATANTAPTGAVNNPISARVSSGKRQLGLIPATVRVRFTAAPPAGYLTGASITLPLLNTAIRAATKGTVGVYLGVAVIVTGTSVERAQ